MANDLRIAIKLANDTIYNEDNKSEYTSGIELFVLAKQPHQIVWAQIGYPYLFLDRPERNLISMGSQLDLSSEFTKDRHTLAPLPAKLLGVETSSDFTVETFKPSARDRMILISRSGVPPEVFSISAKDRTVDGLSRIMSNDNSQLPFWLGILDLTSA